MAVDNTTNTTIYNPAAVVNTVSKHKVEGSAVSATPSQPNQSNKAVKVEVSHQISAVSRARAAAGDSNLSAETLAAISQGKLPPAIAQQSIPPEAVQAAEQTAQIQQNDSGNHETVDYESAEALVRASQAFEQASQLAGKIITSPPAEALVSPAPAVAEAAPVQTQDTATVALGNSADITV